MAPRARVARGRAAKQAEIDDEDEDETEDEDGSDDDSGGETQDRPQELEDLLWSFGSGAGLSAKVWRVSLRPEDLNAPGVHEGYAGFISKGKVKAETLEDEVIKLAGGGVFKLDFYVDSVFAKGASRQISINGPAVPKGQTAPSVSAPVTAPALSEEAMEAKIRGRIEAETAKKREMADLLAAAIAPLAAKLSAFEQRPASAPTMADRYFEKQLLDGDGKPKGDPQLKILLDKFEKQEEREKERDRESARAEKKALQDQVNALQAKLNEPAAKAATPQSQAAAMFAPVAEALAVSVLMNKVESVAEENDDDSLMDLVKEFKGPLFKQLKNMARGVMKGAAESLAQKAGAQSAPAASIPAGFSDWALFFLSSNDAMTKAQDVEWVRASLAIHRAQIVKACAITNREQLAGFAGEFLGPVFHGQIMGLDDAAITNALTLVGALRESVRKADATPAPQPVQATVVEDDEDETDSDEDEDTDEDQEDDDE